MESPSCSPSVGYGSRNPVTVAQLARIRLDGTGLEPLTQGENGSGYPSFHRMVGSSSIA